MASLLVVLFSVAASAAQGEAYLCKGKGVELHVNPVTDRNASVTVIEDGALPVQVGALYYTWETDKYKYLHVWSEENLGLSINLKGERASPNLYLRKKNYTFQNETYDVTCTPKSP